MLSRASPADRRRVSVAARQGKFNAFSSRRRLARDLDFRRVAPLDDRTSRFLRFPSDRPWEEGEGKRIAIGDGEFRRAGASRAKLARASRRVAKRDSSNRPLANEI